MVNATSTVEPQVFAINNIQDAFDIINRGFQVYSNVANGTSASPTKEAQTATNPESSTPAAGQKRARSYQPDLDIYETADAVLIEVSLPGVDKAGINVEHDSKLNRIILTGESKRRHGEEVKLIRTERPVGRFERVVGLGQQVILADQISAAYTDGVLHLTVPKNKEAETKRKISVL